MAAIARVASQDPGPPRVFIMEGIALILFGVAAIAWPGMTVKVFLTLFAFYALISGVIGVVMGIVRINLGWQSVARILVGALLIAAGSYVLNNPGISALSLAYFVAFAFLIRGVIDVVVAASEETPHRGLMVISGIAAVLVGLIILRYPVGGGLAYVWVLGIYALVSGPIMLAIGMGAGQDKD